MKKLTALVLCSFLAAISLRADVIWQETFNYSNGPVSITSTNGTGSTTISNWVTHSGSQDCYVNNHRLEVSTTTAYGGVTATRSGDVNRQFSTTSGSIYTNVQQVIYASFIVNFTNLPTANSTYFAHFHYGIPSSTSYEGKLFALAGNPAQTTNNFTALPNTFRLGVCAAGTGNGAPSATFPVDLALNTDYQVVLFWDPAGNADITLWVNPVSSADVSVASNDGYSPTVANIANSFAFRQASGFGGFLTISNLVIATTFSEAATNVWATNAVAPTIVYQPTAVTSNFVGGAVSLSAVANGQGLVSLTYQWQVSAAANNSNPVNVSGADFSGVNANILNINNAQPGDSGYYTLVVTTPYGLSTTSSVAKVAITSAPVPPAFITQPASQSVYKGVTVTLTTSVSSPGNVSYTWYSNNVVVTAGQNDSGASSSYVLNNVQTNFAASYKVAVTNSVVPTQGIVSTNAVLAVLIPQQVTIAYLRSLVDPLNGYYPTNSPPTIAYQVTGTVTTFTNLTTGNTASYYLQDGTAGIDIFATGGSTFRPAQGDVVTFIGVLSGYTTGLELYADTYDASFPYTSYTDTGNTAPLPTPISIPFNVVSAYGLNFVNTNLAGSLVKLTDVYFGTNAGTTIATTANETITVTNSSGQSFNLFFADLDLDTAGQTLPSYAYSVSGAMYGMNTNFSVAVTRFADIVTAAPSSIPLNLAYSGGILTFTWSDPSFVLQSSAIVSGPYTTISGASSGFTTNTTSGATLFFRLYHP
jgi:hypothetical protein